MEALFYLADQNPHRDRSLGITEYSRGLISNLVTDHKVAVTVLTSKSAYQGENNIKSIALPFRTDRFPGRIAADFLHPLWLPKSTLVHYPKGFLPAMRPKADLICGTVHDLILQHYADNYPHARSKFAYLYWLHILKQSITRFGLILTVSEFSAAAIRNFCSRHHLACPPIRVTYEGCRWENEPWILTEKADYVIHLGSREPHKRTETAVRFWKTTAPPNLRLLIVGSVTNEVARSISEVSTIDWQPAVSSQQLKDLMARSRALLLPSEIEGFGLPAIEAYAVGTSVVYVSGTAVEEILGRNTVGGFQLDDLDSLSYALDKVLNLSPEKIQAKRTELLTKFSWNECGRKTVAAYRELNIQ
jgi:glycosyltransferase involved in cell wall biosynthesis